MNSNISIIIPSINRPHYLKRALTYWSESQFELIVVTNVAFEFPSVKVIISDSDFFSRIKMAIEESSKDYCILCPDDDFMGFNALTECARILDTDKSCSSVVGNISTFQFGSDGKIKWSALKKMPAHTEDNLEERITSGFTSYSNNYWMLYRKEVLIKILQSVEGVPNFNLGEMLFKLGAILQGQIRSCNRFLWLREIIPTSWGRTEIRGLAFIKSLENSQIMETLNSNVLRIFSPEIPHPINHMTSCYESFLNTPKENKKRSLKEKIKKKLKKILHPKDIEILLMTKEEKEDFSRMEKVIKQFGSL